VGADVVGLKNYYASLLKAFDNSSAAGNSSYIEKQ
jgi:hypothetical protein